MGKNLRASRGTSRSGTAPRHPRPRPHASIGAAAFKARCLELLDHVKDSRAEYVVTRHGRPVARLVPVETPRETGSRIGSMLGSVLAYDGPFDPVPAGWDIDQPDSRETGKDRLAIDAAS